MEFTVEQKNTILSILEKKEKNIWEGTGFFYLDNYICEKYLNVINDTWHRPTCTIINPERYWTRKPDPMEMVEIKAVFYGANGSPVRYGKIPVHLIRVEPPKIRSIYYLSKNLIQSKIFNKKLNFTSYKEEG
jgi:hypothetical protein